MSFRNGVLAKLLLISLAVFSGAMPAHAAAAAGNNTMSIPDLQAAARALGFLETAPRDGSFVIGIVYAASSVDGRSAASQLGQYLNTVAGPNKTVIRSEIVSTADLARFDGRLDALLLLPGAATEPSAISEVLRRRQLVSISNDPACLDANCCVLLVRTGRTTEIVLNTQLATDAGVRFSSVFTMMVKRR